jgi:hypothetical protein
MYQNIKNIMREHGYSFYNFKEGKKYYVASLSVKGDKTVFEIVDALGIIIFNETI